MTTLEPGPDGKLRCFGNKPGQALYAKYHDTEWGVPMHDDKTLFAFLILEGAQAGLSWETILKKRRGYEQAFCNFNPKQVAKLTDAELKVILETGEVVRNRLKVFSARTNARVFLDIQKEWGSFDAYVWSFVGGKPIQNHWQTLAEVPVETAESRALAKDLKRRGMKFVGSTIMYAYMQAIGMVDDHVKGCYKYHLRRK